MRADVNEMVAHDKLCACPRCGRVGQLVVAISYHETLMLYPIADKTVSAAPQSALSGMPAVAGMIAKYMGIVSAPLVAIRATIRMRTHGSEEEHRNAEVDLARIDRDNELNYCEQCNAIFDRTGNARDASATGFAKLMSVRR